MPRLDEVNREPAERLYRGLARGVHGVMNVIAKRDWRHAEKIPQTGGLLFVANHISNADPIALGEFIIYSGRWPRMIAKIDLFRYPVIGPFARGCGQIPVDRTSTNAADVLKAAEDAIAGGLAVLIYPEGTITGDPLGWPMVPRTGAARLALATRCPVVPIGQWGANEIMPGRTVTRPHFFPRKTMTMLVGDPIDLSDLYSDEPSRHDVQVASERIMDVITDLVAEIRQETPPETRWDHRILARVPKGVRGV
ncbi:MAG TPA: lysophospholipid acyltransferase family protein [Propionibacteriaceae bacterium]|nr:lysophospholipid acyltransferase family protein [Propionibacteriaceae bacterium]